MSFTKGISFHHETNASSQPTINNNISIRASNELSQSNIVIDSVKKDERVVEQSVDSTTIQNETEFLKKVLDIYMNQRFYFSGKHIILKPDELLELLTILLPDKSINIIGMDKFLITMFRKTTGWAVLTCFHLSNKLTGRK